MKKAILLLLCTALTLCACTKDGPSKGKVKESDLKGETVDVESLFPAYSSYRKLFVLNEGQMGSNNASLDIIRVSDGQYITGVFKKMNPSAGAGLGDVGNDIVVIGDEVWLIVNNSGIVEVLSAENEKEIAAIKVPTPRRIAYDDKYVYVSSWAGAYAEGTYIEGNYTITASANPKGQVYRIDRKKKKVVGSVEVGYQPEGLACHDGKLYVANSGGISFQLPPNYSYDNTLSVIDLESFSVTKSIEVAINLKDVYVDKSRKSLLVSSLGDYYNIHSALFEVQSDGKVINVGNYATVSAALYNDIYCFGNRNELDWRNPVKDWDFWSYANGTKTGIGGLELDGVNPYSLYMAAEGVFLIGDAGDCFNPGTLSLFVNNEKVWTVTAGVCPGHFAVW